MQLNTSLSHRMELRTVIAPRMIQSMEILQLPIMALQERIEHELEENPVLELRDTETEEGTVAEEAETAVAVEEPSTDVADSQKELVIEDSTDNEQDFDHQLFLRVGDVGRGFLDGDSRFRSEEHTSELQSPMY